MKLDITYRGDTITLSEEEKEDCFICGKSHTIEHYKTKGKYQGSYTYDEPHPDYYIGYCENCNTEYQSMKQQNRDSQYKFERKVLAKVRKAIKSHNAKTLSIRRGKTYVFDIEISPMVKNHNYRCFNDDEVNALKKFGINTTTKTNFSYIKDLFYFYLTRKHLIGGV
jgi:hypothetical protein